MKSHEFIKEAKGTFYVYHKVTGDRWSGPDYELLKTCSSKEEADAYASEYNQKKGYKKGQGFHHAVVRTNKVKELDESINNLAPDATLNIDQLESNANSAVINAVIKSVRELIGQGHTDVEPSVITNMVVSSTGKPFLLKDLVAVNNKSEEIQHYIDSINPSKVKFSTEILTVKNEDPVKEKEKAQTGVSNMASRAANRNRSL